MENYFQAEAYNLDKVLDEFEQNEGENYFGKGIWMYLWYRECGVIRGWSTF